MTLGSEDPHVNLGPQLQSLESPNHRKKFDVNSRSERKLELPWRLSWNDWKYLEEEPG